MFYQTFDCFHLVTKALPTNLGKQLNMKKMLKGMFKFILLIQLKQT